MGHSKGRSISLPALCLTLCVAFLVHGSSAQGPKKVVVLSDVHMGDDTPQCTYQKSIHEPYLLAILDWVIANKATVAEVILAGDIFDTWTYPFSVKPPTIGDILKANPNFVAKLGEVMDAISGPVTFMPGNHDMQATEADLAPIVSPKGKKMKFAASSYNPLQDKRLFVEHGHNYCLFNAPDPTSPFPPLPVGHFVTRMVAEMWSKKLKPGENVATKPGHGAPNGLDWSEVATRAIKTGDISVVNTLLDGVRGITETSETDPITLWDGKVTSIKDAKARLSSPFTRFSNANGGGADGLIIAGKAALADFKDYFLGWFAQRKAFEVNAEMVVLGHTHYPLSDMEQSLVTYINTGYVCPATPDMPGRKVTFVVVDMNTDKPLTGSVYEIKKTGDKYEALPTTAPTTKIVESIFQDFSCYAVVDNSQGSQALTLAQQSVDSGRFVNLPQSVPAGGKATIWVQDRPGPVGSGAEVVYKTSNGQGVLFNFACPTTSKNIAYGGSKFMAASETPDKDWSPVVPRGGHPLFAKFMVTSAVQGAFTRSGSELKSDAGLQPGQTATINGQTDLSGTITGNSGAKVYSMKVRKASGVTAVLYSYTIEVDGQGPKGFGSGSMCLSFFDMAGNKQTIKMFSSTRQTHTTSYNSDSPAIKTIQWSNC